MTNLKGRKENRGGARPGSGPKPVKKSWSESIKKDVSKHIQSLSKETGMTFGEVLARMLWDPKDKVQAAVRLGAAKLISEILVVKESHKTVEKIQGPVIGLPEIERRVRDGQQEGQGQEGKGQRERRPGVKEGVMLN